MGDRGKNIIKFIELFKSKYELDNLYDYSCICHRLDNLIKNILSNSEIY